MYCTFAQPQGVQRLLPKWKKYICKIHVKVYKIYFSKSCIFKIYNIYIFAKIYLTHIWHILDISLNYAEIYFHGQKLYMSHLYLISMEVKTINQLINLSVHLFAHNLKSPALNLEILMPFFIWPFLQWKKKLFGKNYQAS